MRGAEVITVFALVFLGLALAAAPPKTCRVSETMPAADGGPNWTRWVTVLCEEKPPSSAWVELEVNPEPTDANAVKVDGGRW